VQLKQRVLDRHTLVVGVEYRENLHQHVFNYDDRPRFTYIDDRRSGRTFGVYAQAEAVLRTNLLLNAGLRYDYYYTIGGTLNPRVGLIYSPWEKTTFKLLYGQAFRAPNDYELYYEAPSSNQAPNPKLKPETIRTYELAYEQYLPAHVRFGASAFHYDINDLISQTLKPTTGFYFFDNVDRVRANGVEFELEGKYPGGLLARASYTLQRAEDADTGAELSGSPRHLAKLNLSVPLYRDKIFSGLEVQYESRVKTLSGSKADDFVILNWTLFSQRLVKGLELSASVYNLLDTKYGYPGARDHLQAVIPQDGRGFRVKLTYKF
jgi:iron complex outermembrane receptor protein